jgi:hypothetical protein
MNTELHKKIEEKHLYFFKYLDEEGTPMVDTEKPIRDSVQKLLKQDKIVVPMQFGIECGDGWFWLNYVVQHRMLVILKDGYILYVGPVEKKIVERIY